MVLSNYFTKLNDFSMIIQDFFKFHDFSMHGTVFFLQFSRVSMVSRARVTPVNINKWGSIFLKDPEDTNETY